MGPTGCGENVANQISTEHLIRARISFTPRRKPEIPSFIYVTIPHGVPTVRGPPEITSHKHGLKCLFSQIRYLTGAQKLNNLTSVTQLLAQERSSLGVWILFDTFLQGRTIQQVRDRVLPMVRDRADRVLVMVRSRADRVRADV
jgi:hypothetical protein